MQNYGCSTCTAFEPDWTKGGCATGAAGNARLSALRQGWSGSDVCKRNGPACVCSIVSCPLVSTLPEEYSSPKYHSKLNSWHAKEDQQLSDCHSSLSLFLRGWLSVQIGKRYVLNKSGQKCTSPFFLQDLRGLVAVIEHCLPPQRKTMRSSVDRRWTAIWHVESYSLTRNSA